MLKLITISLKSNLFSNHLWISFRNAGSDWLFFFHSLSLRVVLPYGWPSPPVNGSRSHRTHSLNKKKEKGGQGGAHEEKLLFTCVSSKVKNTRIQHRSPWPSRPYDPPAHGGIRSGLSFPPCSPLCCADACLSASHREQILHAQEAGTSPCLLSLQNLPPYSVFSVRGERKKKKVSITKERTWMVALLVWGALLVHLYNRHRCKRPEPTTAKLYCNLDFMCWSDKQDDAVFVAFTSLSLMVKSRLLTIFIRWGVEALQMWEPPTWKKSVFSSVILLHKIHFWYISVLVHWVKLRSRLQIVHLYLKSHTFLCICICIESRIICPYSTSEFPATKCVLKLPAPLSSWDLRCRTVCFPAHSTVWLHFLQLITI